MAQKIATVNLLKEDSNRMPGHWLLAMLGKKVLRPGGLELTRKMLVGLDVQSDDRVVEFAPGLGVTARMTLSANSLAYTAIERDATATDQVRHWLEQVRFHSQGCRNTGATACRHGRCPAKSGMRADPHQRD